MNDASYTVANANIASQVIDGEVIVLDLLKGFYYSLRGTGAEAWKGLIVQGLSVENLSSDFAARYEGDVKMIRESVQALVRELEQEGLIVAGPAKGDVKKELPAPAQKTPFTAPKLEKYTDMQELLLLDPIHEADAVEGWPKKAA